MPRGTLLDDESTVSKRPRDTTRRFRRSLIHSCEGEAKFFVFLFYTSSYGIQRVQASISFIFFEGRFSEWINSWWKNSWMFLCKYNKQKERNLKVNARFGSAVVSVLVVYIYIYMGHSTTVWAISGGDVSDLPRNSLYESTCRKTHTQFFFYFFLKISFFHKKKSPLKSEKIHINLI